MSDSLVYLPVEKWMALQKVFKEDWPRGISGYMALETQRKLIEQGLNYGFKVYCAYGDMMAGMVAINEKNGFYEIIIQCPSNDTQKLEEALKKTDLINWDRHIIIPFAPNNVVECVRRAIKAVDVEITHVTPSEMFILDRCTQPFQDISLPPNVTYSQLAPDHIDLVNSTWPHRYPTSPSYFELLIASNNSHGLFLNGALICWVFINDVGGLGHLYTVEEHRRKGYAELLLKLVCNVRLKEGNDVLAFCVKSNLNACKMYRKVGFERCESVAWYHLNKKK